MLRRVGSDRAKNVRLSVRLCCTDRCTIATTNSLSSPPWKAALAGKVFVPGAPGYEAARKPAMARFHQIRLLAIVERAIPGDVTAALAFARRSDVNVAVGGRPLLRRALVDRGVVIDVTPTHAMAVADGVATVDAGARTSTTRWTRMG
jgi:hypothetical protein